ncbi:methionyl-tRNA formyltransferase [Endomicrobium proavitum]|uniref:Methionyl-tRNA formyltransferase n=1 Tax=Endomicrobium proavitum TaxID=1408281 RepID=A0A0G3WJL4_9BACT|nr:methionyl-tRNA formyltransferase [Endomicrobium proavitum]AKL98052.1 Methionyl-tRNA formyltransferase [Endomicrobium proavitum]
MKILYFGTASISKSFLEVLFKDKHEIFCVTMPDKPAFRGQKLTPPAVKSFALEKCLQIIQPEKFTQDVIDEIKNFNADAGVVVAYGKLIPRAVFDLPKFKTFNIHFSLLPKYRGAAPVQFAVLNGEKETGVSSFYIEEALDAGKLLVQEKLPVDIKDTSESLFAKLIPLGIDVMRETLSLFEQGETQGYAQEGTPTFARTFKKEDGLLDWNKSAFEIYNKIRAFYPWPGTFSLVSRGKLEGKRIKFIEVEILDDKTENSDTGKVYSIEKNAGFTVLCKTGKILVKKVQPDNKPVMSAWGFLQSGQLAEGDFFGGLTVLRHK